MTGQASLILDLADFFIEILLFIEIFESVNYYFIKIIFKFISTPLEDLDLGFWEIYMLEKNPQQLQYLANRLSYSLLTWNYAGIVPTTIITVATAVATVVAMAVATAADTVVATVVDITTTMEAF